MDAAAAVRQTGLAANLGCVRWLSATAALQQQQQQQQQQQRWWQPGLKQHLGL
jgi:hypothetical protein